MFCKKCGTQISDNAVFCHECGAPVQTEQPYGYEEPAGAQYIPVAQTENYPAPDATPILVLGILSLALPALGGLICAIICRKKVKAYVSGGGRLTGIAKVGNILSIVGLAISIATCVYIAVYLCIIFAMYGTVLFTMIAGTLSNNYSY